MNVINFDSGKCKKIRDYLDSYINDELTVETRREVSTHMEDCSVCSRELEARLRAKSLLKNAVMREAAPAELRAKIQRELHKGASPSSSWRYWIAVAAMFALLATGWGMARLWRSPSTSNPAIRASLDHAGAEVLRVGLANHVRCAVEHRFADRRFSSDEMSSKLGPDYSGLVSLVEREIAGEYDIAVGHRCRVGNREYIHLILKGDRATVSLALTKKDGESFERVEMAAVLSASGVPIYESNLEGYEVAGFESGDYLAFVVSDLAGGDNLHIASTLAGGVRDYLARLRAQVG